MASTQSSHVFRMLSRASKSSSEKMLSSFMLVLQIEAGCFYCLWPCQHKGWQGLGWLLVAAFYPAPDPLDAGRLCGLWPLALLVGKEARAGEGQDRIIHVGERADHESAIVAGSRNSDLH